METRIKTLGGDNGGFVRLVAYMQPVPREERNPMGEIIGYSRPAEWTGDLEVSRNARVSYNADWRASGEDEKLIQYMYTNGHTSPFEAMVFTFEIVCPIFIARQWHRHRTWSFNEVSARYAQLPGEFYIPDVEAVGVQHSSNKQMRSLVEDMSEQEMIERTAELDMVIEHHTKGYKIYEGLMELGWPRELARGVLGLAIYTRFFGTVDAHNLFHFIKLRDHSHAQLEIQVYAKAMKELIRQIMPHSVNALEVAQREMVAIEALRGVLADVKDVTLAEAVEAAVASWELAKEEVLRDAPTDTEH